MAAAADEDDSRDRDRVLVIFPFEEEIYRDAGVPVEFVGHPLVDLAAPATRQRFSRRLHLRPTAPTVAILPGSRPNEVHRILPTSSAPPTAFAPACRARSSSSPAPPVSTMACSMPSGAGRGDGGRARPTRCCRRRTSR